MYLKINPLFTLVFLLMLSGFHANSFTIRWAFLIGARHNGQLGLVLCQRLIQPMWKEALLQHGSWHASQRDFCPQATTFGSDNLNRWLNNTGFRCTATHVRHRDQDGMMGWQTLASMFVTIAVTMYVTVITEWVMEGSYPLMFLWLWTKKLLLAKKLLL